ncbi:MAG: GMC family oxidoreductase, partial [Acidobacteria bacterium]|nr:GMC family oxidoreductase [Acidobacteriota bacterium]
DTHQITNPNTKQLVTGWDVAGFKGPMEWEEEEQRRAMMKKAYPFWFEGDLVKRNNASAAPAIKTAEGKDYYDVVVLGAGTAGCIVAGRLAERGINPKTGDRLRIAVIEGGDDWIIRDPTIRPGYGTPVRRRLITNINYESDGPENQTSLSYTWRYARENFKLVGGCSTHFTGDCFMHTEDDFTIFRQTTGVDWNYGESVPAIEEVREMYHVYPMPEVAWNRGSKLFAEAARAMGFDVVPNPLAKRNCLDSNYCGEGHLCRYDAKGSSLPWLYIGLNNGLKLIANSEVVKIIIEKPGGTAPVATGVVYKDKTGKLHEVRAARIIVACGTMGTALLLYQSGYGPRDIVGSNLIVENQNVGHFDADALNAYPAHFPEPVAQARGGSAFGMFPLKPSPRGELDLKFDGLRISSELGGKQYPHPAAISQYAPAYGWKHKEWMREGGWLRLGSITARIRVLPWSWRVSPRGQYQQVSFDAARINAAAKEGAEVVYALYEKMSLKPLEVDKRITPIRSPHNVTGSARAGSSRENSVCNSDFECHDIDHLLFTSLATMPRCTYSHGCGPAALSGSYGYRAFLKNHFSKGCSTKGFA